MTAVSLNPILVVGPSNPANNSLSVTSPPSIPLPQPIHEPSSSSAELAERILPILLGSWFELEKLSECNAVPEKAVMSAIGVLIATNEIEGLGRALCWVASRGLLKPLKMIVESQHFIEVNQMYIGGALCRAAEGNHLDIMGMLLHSERFGLPYLNDSLVCAASHGHVEAVRMLLQNKHSGKINCLYRGMALKRAVTKQHLDVAKELIQCKGGIDSTYVIIALRILIEDYSWDDNADNEKSPDYLNIGKGLIELHCQGYPPGLSQIKELAQKRGYSGIVSLIDLEAQRTFRPRLSA